MTREKAVDQMRILAHNAKVTETGNSVLVHVPYWKIEVTINDTGNLGVYPKNGGGALCLLPLKSVKSFGHELSGGIQNLVIRLNNCGLIRIRAL